MTTLDSLTLRANAAMMRLADLQRRAEKSPPAHSALTNAALKELAAALADLDAATTQMRALAADLKQAREGLEKARAEHVEFVNVIPLPCVWTDPAGVIEAANEAAADLLNVSVRRLSDRTLSLYITDRTEFTAAVSTLREGRSDTVEFAAVIRPRERRTRTARIIGSRVKGDVRLCWILHQIPE